MFSRSQQSSHVVARGFPLPTGFFSGAWKGLPLGGRSSGLDPGLRSHGGQSHPSRR